MDEEQYTPVPLPWEEVGRERYESKRRAGISTRRLDGSQRSVETDINAAAAEKYTAEIMGCEFNDEIYADKGDGGFDFLFSLSIEVIWIGMIKGTTKPRESGHLIMNPYQSRRWADIYVCVKGSVESGFDILGWTTHKVLASKPKKNFGYGEKFAISTGELYPIDKLLGLKVR